MIHRFGYVTMDVLRFSDLSIEMKYCYILVVGYTFVDEVVHEVLHAEFRVHNKRAYPVDHNEWAEADYMHFQKSDVIFVLAKPKFVNLLVVRLARKVLINGYIVMWFVVEYNMNLE